MTAVNRGRVGAEALRCDRLQVAAEIERMRRANVLVADVLAELAAMAARA